VEWDLGLQGLGLLALMSLAFGAIAHLVASRSTTRWVGVIGTAAYFIGGLLISEVWFGWATEEELQPNIDGRGALARHAPGDRGAVRSPLRRPEASSSP
jgi:hypothetical protein